MKKTLIIFIGVFLILIFCLTACGGNSNENDENDDNGGSKTESVGLIYAVNDDGKTCTIRGIGTCQDTNVIIGKYIDNYLVTNISNNAFEDCANLTGVTIPDSVISIGPNAFSSCYSLQNILIPDSVTTIGEKAFYSCNNLQNVKIGYGVTKIGDSAFRYCSAILDITVDEKNAEYKSIDGNLYSKDGKTLIKYSAGKSETSFTVPDGVTHIEREAFRYSKNLTRLTISDSVTNIGNYAFGSCTKLINIEIGKGVTNISISAFESCTSLFSIVIPENVTNISDYAFDGCINLKIIVIPYSVKKIGSFAFYGCASLSNVHFTGTPEQWKMVTVGSGNTNLTDASINYISKN